MADYMAGVVTRVSQLANRPLFPLASAALAFAATLLVVAFVPALCALVALQRRQWVRVAFSCAIGSALGATLLAWLVAEYGTQAIAGLMPGMVRSGEWAAGLRWVEHFGFVVLIAFASLPVSQTPVLIVCALLGMPLSHVFISVLLGKVMKYFLYAAFTASMLNQLTLRQQIMASDGAPK